MYEEIAMCYLLGNKIFTNNISVNPYINFGKNATASQNGYTASQTHIERKW